MKFIFVKIAMFLLNVVYFFIKLFTRTKNKVTMISRQSNNITLDFELIDKEIKKHKKYTTVILCKELEGKESAKLKTLVKYGLHMFRQMYHIATSKVVILDSYCICISILHHKKSLRVIQIWHSVGTMKKFGYDILDQKEGNTTKIAKAMRMHKNYNYILCAGEGYKEDLARQFGYDLSTIKIIPLPRIELLKDKKYIDDISKEIYKEYPILKKKKNIIYVPTFRKNEKNFGKQLNELIDSIDYDKYNFIIKLHPLSKVKINNNKVIIDNKFSSIQMTFVSDYVITDYSCILYEAGLINKPLYFYAFDYDEYNKNRQLNLDYFKDLPGVKSKDYKEILTAIKSDKYDFKELKVFIDKYIDRNVNSLEEIYKLIDKK